MPDCFFLIPISRNVIIYLAQAADIITHADNRLKPVGGHSDARLSHALSVNHALTCYNRALNPSV